MRSESPQLVNFGPHLPPTRAFNKPRVERTVSFFCFPRAIWPLPLRYSSQIVFREGCGWLRVVATPPHFANHGIADVRLGPMGLGYARAGGESPSSEDTGRGIGQS